MHVAVFSGGGGCSSYVLEIVNTYIIEKGITLVCTKLVSEWHLPRDARSYMRSAYLITGPDGRVVWGAGRSSRELQVAGSILVAALTRDSSYHRDFGELETYNYM